MISSRCDDYISMQFNNFFFKRLNFVNKIICKFKWVRDVEVIISSSVIFICYNFFHQLSKFFIEKNELNMVSVSNFLTSNSFSMIAPVGLSFQASLGEFGKFCDTYIDLFPVLYVIVGTCMMEIQSFKELFSDVVSLFIIASNNPINGTFEGYFPTLIKSFYGLGANLNSKNAN